MIKTQDYSELVDQAFDGDGQALSRLAEMVHPPLKSYVLRITLSEDLADDIVQGTILEMFKIFGQLKNKDSFWPWLCKIALNKIRTKSTTQNRQRELLEKHAEQLASREVNIEGLSNVINKEIKEAIFKSMSRLNDQQKAILSLRCFENLPFSKIAYVMGISEFNSRIIFHRAKKKLQKHLCISGFSKKNLLGALVIFGKLTAPSEAAAASISITPGTLSSGALATSLATATTKTAIVLTTTGAIAIGTVTHTAINNTSESGQQNQSTLYSSFVSEPIESNISTEGYYYYPNGSNGPVMMRLSVSSSSQTTKVLQNDHGNYIQKGSAVILQNQHYWNEDLSVLTLPTDSRQFKQLLGSEGPAYSEVPEIFAKTHNLLFAASKNQQTDQIDLTVHKYDAMMEERFQYNWPSNSKVIDQRDDLHRQGWGYVAMSGTLKGRKISGMGRIPFTYSANNRFPAVMMINIGNETAISASAGKAIIETAKGSYNYPGGTFFTGLNKPWMGLHCVDTVRRDAAKNGIQFKSELVEDKTKCKVSLFHENSIIVYTIDMQADLIEEISFIDQSGDSTGNITFEYSMNRPEDYNSLKSPADTDLKETKQMHWLAEMASNNL